MFIEKIKRTLHTYLYRVFVAMLLFKFHIRIVSSELQVIIEPGGNTDFCPSLVRGYISSPQIHAEWNKNECDFPTYQEEEKYHISE